MSSADSSVYQLTWSRASHPANSAKDFGERHNLHGWALPFRGRPIDPLDFLERLGEYLNDRPPYCQRVSHDVIDSELNPDGKMWWNSDLAEMAMLTHGWWFGGETGHSRYYCNPNYCHRHPESDIHTDPDSRRAFLDVAAGFGMTDPYELAVPFGIRASDNRSAGSSVTKIISRMEYPWGASRSSGRDRMGRTWATLDHWGYTRTAIGSAFACSRETVRRHINRVGLDFTPPDDPTPEVVQ